MNQNEQILLEDLKTLFPTFKCTLQDLKNPSEAFVHEFYTFWLTEFEVNISSISQIQFSQMQNTQSFCLYSDAYSAAIPKVNLLSAIRAFNVVPDFGMLDIVSPTPKRTQNVIRAFCEFYKWCDERIGMMMDMKKEMKISERKQLIASLLEERANLQEQLTSVVKIISQLQDSKKELEGELVKYQKMVIELRLKKEMLKRNTEDANEKIKAKEAILHKLAKEEAQIMGKIKDYSNQIVDSPTTILTDLEMLQAKEKELKSLSEQKRDMVESKMKAQEMLKEFLASTEEKNGQLEEMLKLIEHQRKLVQVVKEIEKRTLSCQEDLSQLKSSLISTASKKNNRQQELQALMLKWKTTKDQLTQSIEAAQSELNRQKSAKSKIMSALKEDAAIDEQMNTTLEKIKAQVKAFEVEYEKLLKQENETLEKIKSEVLAKAERVKKEVEKRTRKKKSRQ